MNDFAVSEALEYEGAEATETIRKAVEDVKAGEEEAVVRGEEEAAVREEETAEEEYEELTYVEQVGNKHCPLADGRNMFQDSCHR